MSNYEGQLYGKIKNRYHELQATTEDFDKLKDIIEAQKILLEECEIMLGISANCLEQDNPNTANTVKELKDKITTTLKPITNG